jgi:hypothetical protein
VVSGEQLVNRLAAQLQPLKALEQLRFERLRLVLWTTLYMDRALSQPQDLGAIINDQDVARLSPLGTNHINVLGRYHFALPDAIARGEFRPLRDPTVFEDEDLMTQPGAVEGF